MGSRSSGAEEESSKAGGWTVGEAKNAEGTEEYDVSVERTGVILGAQQ